MIHSNKPRDFAPMVFLFLLCILIRIFYLEENNRYDLPLTSQYMRWRLILSVRCILSASKYLTKITMPSAQKKKQEPMGMNLCAFSSAVQEVYIKLENQAKCDSSVFVTNSLKIHFSYTFWLLEVVSIARTNYNCNIGHCAQPVSFQYICETLKMVLKSRVGLENKTNAKGYFFKVG